MSLSSSDKVAIFSKSFNLILLFTFLLFFFKLYCVVFVKKEKLKDIANFINNFKEPDKTYFYLKYFINMESKEIAKKYNTTLSSVENRLYRCRLALKKFIDGGV